MKEIVLETNLEGWIVFVPVKRDMQGIPSRGMIKREGRHGVIYSIICMCTCGWSPSYMRRRDAEKDWIGVLPPDPEKSRMSYEGHQGNTIKMCCVGKSIWSLSSVSLYRCPYGLQNFPKAFTTFLFMMWQTFFFFWLWRTRFWSIFQASVDRKNIYMQKTSSF